MSSKLHRFCRALKRSSADFNANLIHHGQFHEFESLTSELSTTDRRHHSDTRLDLNPTTTYLDEPSATHITEAVHNFLDKPVNPHSDRGSSLPPQEPLTQTQVTFPFDSEPDNSYFEPDSSDSEIAFKKLAVRELNTLIEDLRSLSQCADPNSPTCFESALDVEDQYIDDTIADHSRMAEGFDGYEQPNNRDQTRHKVVNSFGTHTNTSRNVLDDADTQPTSDTPAALAQTIAELSQISANQRHFKDGLDKLSDNQHRLQAENAQTVDLVTGLQKEVAAVQRQIKEEISTAKQYTHSLFNNLKLEFNPRMDQLTEWQAQLELQMQQDLVPPPPPSTNPFASTPQSSNPPQMNAVPVPSHINTPTSHPVGDNHRPPHNLHGENWLSGIAGEAPPPGIRTDHSVSSHVNEETLQLAAMGPNILMASITQAQLASTKLQVASKITTFDGNRSNYRT